MLKKLLNSQINSITLAAALIGTTSLLSRLLGIFRDRILAGEFGAGDTLDIYYAAFRIPDLMYNLIVLGALSAGFIPLFTDSLRRGKLSDLLPGSEKHAESWRLASNIINVLTLALLILSLSGFVLAPFLIKFIAPGFTPEKQLAAVGLTRIMFLSPIFLGISGICGGILQSFKNFFAYSLSPILYNVGIILGALYLVPRWGISGLAWGVALGAFLHFLVQVPALMGLGFHYQLVFDLKDVYLRKILLMMAPRTLSLLVSQLGLVVTTIIASALPGGSLAVFNFANNLQSFPIGIFGISYAIAAFPAMSAAAFDRPKLAERFSMTARQILFFIAPSTVLLLALRAQIIRVVLGTGNFNWDNTIMTMNTMGFFVLSLFAQALIPLQARVFYARHNSLTPFLIGLGSVAANLGLAYYLTPIYGAAGLALAFSIASIANFAALWMAIRIELGTLDEAEILVSTVKFSLAAIAAGFAVQGAKEIIEPYIDMDTFLGVSAQTAFAGLSGLLVYLAFCSLLRSQEFIAFWQSFKRRLPWRKVEVGDQGEARGI